uniref:LigA n=1 Tax=Parastrongyloides trichosuri TaxID=131310 RepID=A0A0N5A4S3_PARTI
MDHPGADAPTGRRARRRLLGRAGDDRRRADRPRPAPGRVARARAGPRLSERTADAAGTGGQRAGGAVVARLGQAAGACGRRPRRGEQSGDQSDRRPARKRPQSARRHADGSLRHRGRLARRGRRFRRGGRHSGGGAGAPGARPGRARPGRPVDRCGGTGSGRGAGDGLGLAGSGGGLGRFRRLARAAKGRADGEAGRSGRAGRAVVPDRRRHPAAGDAPAGRADVEPRRLARRLLHPAAPPAVDGGGGGLGDCRSSAASFDRRAPDVAARDGRGARRLDRRGPNHRRAQPRAAGAGRRRRRPVAMAGAGRAVGLGRLAGSHSSGLRLWLRPAGGGARGGPAVRLAGVAGGDGGGAGGDDRPQSDAAARPPAAGGHDSAGRGLAGGDRPLRLPGRGDGPAGGAGPGRAAGPAVRPAFGTGDKNGAS